MQIFVYDVHSMELHKNVNGAHEKAGIRNKNKLPIKYIFTCCLRNKNVTHELYSISE